MAWYKCSACGEVQQHEKLEGNTVACDNASCTATVGNGQLYYGLDVYKYARHSLRCRSDHLGMDRGVCEK